MGRSKGDQALTLGIAFLAGLLLGLIVGGFLVIMGNP